MPKAILMVGDVSLGDVLFEKQLPSILVLLACGSVIQVVPLFCNVNNRDYSHTYGIFQDCYNIDIFTTEHNDSLTNLLEYCNIITINSSYILLFCNVNNK